ncbi:YciI family protein [Cellulomonas sp. Marseille-Q8402]
MPTYAVQYTYDQRHELRDEVRPEHRDYLRGLADRGLLLGSGPYADGDPGALLVFTAVDTAALEVLLADDPFARHGLVADVRIREWTLVLGPWAEGLAG